MRLKSVRLRAMLLAACFGSAPAMAACSRAIHVPLAPIGQTVTVEGKQFGGAVPDLLREAGRRSACDIQFQETTRPQAQLAYELGQADMLVPGLRTARRDRYGIFVPMIQIRPMLITLEGQATHIRSARDLLARTRMRLAVIKGFDFGDAYETLIEALTNAKRVEVATDAVAAARLIQSGYVDAMIMPPLAVYTAVRADPRVSGLQGHLRFDALDDMPWADSGVYLSTKALTQPDRDTLQASLSSIARSSMVWDAYRRAYDKVPGFEESVRPLR